LAINNFRYNPLGFNLSDEKLDKLNQEISARVVA
jgi:hypothetical protein